MILVLSVGFLSGCQQTATESEISDNVTLISDIVELVNASMEKKMDPYGIDHRVTVTFLFHNIAGRTIPLLKTTARFYDDDDNLIAMSEPKRIFNLLSDWTEQYDPTFNKIVYIDEDAQYISRAVLVAVEAEE